MPVCRSLGCDNEASLDRDFCGYCIQEMIDIKPKEKTNLSEKYPHYHKDVSHLNSVDFYRVADLFNITDQAIGHAIKKLLVLGGRGAKDYRTDLKEAIDSLQRKLQMLDEDGL